jgi:CheY-like chemotaxis protein
MPSAGSAPRDVAQAVAEQLVAALDRLAAVEASLAPGSAAASSLDIAERAIRRAAELAGRLATLADDSAAIALGSAQRADTRGTASPAPRILVIDDDELVRTSVAAVLLSRRLRVLLAADGREALDLFLVHADDIDAVILDLDLPQMSGSTVLRELRAIRHDVKVVISSGGPLDPLDPHLDGCNQLAFAHKSLGPHELLTQLARLLQQRL